MKSNKLSNKFFFLLIMLENENDYIESLRACLEKIQYPWIRPFPSTFNIKNINFLSGSLDISDKKTQKKKKNALGNSFFP